MAKIQINNPRQIINGGAKKYYFKVKGLGGPKGDKGDKGDTGSQGPQGPQGNAATVSVGSTTTLPVGYGATVTNSGSIYNAVLDFGIPQGPRGPQGAKGDKGDTGAQGETGPRGPQGERGTNATVSIGTTYTLNPGSQATVYNSGSDSNAVLNFGIPRGDVGPQPELVQTTGTSTTKAMSQNATTVALATKQNTIDSSHKLSADLVTDTTTTNKFVTAEDKTTWNAKQNALTAGDNITISGDTISTPALVPEVVASLPAEGTEGKLYLTPKNYTTGTATGNPITATVSEDAGAIESFQLDGDTFQQTYTGKNLVNINFTDSTSNGVTKTLNADGSITLNGHTTAGHNIEIAPAVDFEIGQTYTIHIEVLGGSFVPYNSNQNWAASFVYTKEGNSSLQANITENGATASYTPTSSMVPQSVRLWFGFNSQTTSELAIFNNFTFRAQIEKGSTATSYEPYVGGIPSPNPSYPQPIQTVTGEQTVTINSTDYPISLGSIELCKLGTYQDYIWKDGDDWKVHKATAAYTFSGAANENWARSGQTTSKIFVAALTNASALVGIPSDSIAQTKSNYFRYAESKAVGVMQPNTPNSAGIMSYLWLCFDITSTPDIGTAKTWIATNKPKIYYHLATATDTAITDQTLIAQLEAIRTASLENGTNTITNTATGSNLAGDMEIGYYGYNPTNRYDKFIWLDLNNNYEQIGS